MKNLKNINQIFNRFDKTPITLANYPKIAYEKGFYKDYLSEELKGSLYLNSEIQPIPVNMVLDSLVSKTMDLNRLYNNNPRISEKVYLKDINNDGKVGVGKQSGYYFSLF